MGRVTLAMMRAGAQDLRMWLFTVFQGLSASLRVQESPLYRYPYRSAEESFRGDAKKIGGDIAECMERVNE